MRRLTLLLATGFGLGLSPVASGTAGSLLGVAIVVALQALPQPVWIWELAVGIVLSLLAIPICDVAEKAFGKKDDGRIVADEYLTYPLCMVGIPWMVHPWMLAVGFVVNRAMDVIKIPPARQSQSLKGGLGIVVDDVIACFYGLALNHLILRMVLRYLY